MSPLQSKISRCQPDRRLKGCLKCIPMQGFGLSLLSSGEKLAKLSHGQVVIISFFVWSTTAFNENALKLDSQ
jgi:hypothetical protein